MALRELDLAMNEISSVVDDLNGIDYSTPTEPADSGSQEEWREYGLTVLELLIEAERVTDQAVLDLGN